MNSKNQSRAIYGFKVSGGRRIVAHILCIPMIILRYISMIINFIFKCHKKDTVVIIEPFGMGDVITHEPLVRTLKNNGYSVIFCGRSIWKSIIPESELVCWHDLCVSWSVSSVANKYRVFGNFIPLLIKTIISICKINRGCIGFDTRGDVRSIFLLHIAGCSTVYTLSHYIGSSMRVPHCGVKYVQQNLSKRRWEINMKFAKELGLDISSTAPPNLDHLLKHYNNTTNEIALIPFSAGIGKHWPVDSWLILTRAMRKRNLRFRWYCGPGDRDKTLELFGKNEVCTEIKTVEQWVDALHKSLAVVSVNTGPMHITAALNKPLTAICGSSTLPLWLPEGNKTTVIHHQNELDCIPCHQINSHLTCGNKCMTLVKPQEVMDALVSMIN